MKKRPQRRLDGGMGTDQDAHFGWPFLDFNYLGAQG